jgi:hypothetical protein
MVITSTNGYGLSTWVSDNDPIISPLPTDEELRCSIEEVFRNIRIPNFNKIFTVLDKYSNQ